MKGKNERSFLIDKDWIKRVIRSFIIPNRTLDISNAKEKQIKIVLDSDSQKKCMSGDYETKKIGKSIGSAHNCCSGRPAIYAG